MTARFDINITDNHRLTLNHKEVESSKLNGANSSYGDFAFSSAEYQKGENTTTDGLLLVSNWSDDLITEISYSTKEQKTSQILYGPYMMEKSVFRYLYFLCGRGLAVPGGVDDKKISKRPYKNFCSKHKKLTIANFLGWILSAFFWSHNSSTKKFCLNKQPRKCLGWSTVIEKISNFQPLIFTILAPIHWWWRSACCDSGYARITGREWRRVKKLL